MKLKENNEMFKINKYANRIYLEDGLYCYITLEDLLEMRHNVFHGSSSKIKELFSIPQKYELEIKLKIKIAVDEASWHLALALSTRSFLLA